MTAMGQLGQGCERLLRKRATMPRMSATSARLIHSSRPMRSPLKRENEALPGDAYFGREPSGKGYRFHHPDWKQDKKLSSAMYYIALITVKGRKITLQMINVADGKEWDRFEL